MKGLYQKRGWWYYRMPTSKGEPRAQAIALRTKDEHQALDKALRHTNGTAILAAETKDTMMTVLPLYYAAKAEDSKSSRNARKKILEAFADMMGNPRLRDIDEKLLLTWRRKLATTGGTATTNKPVSPSTMTGYLIVLKAFLNWAIKEGMLRNNPTQSLKRATTINVTRKQHFFSIETREKLLAEPCLDYIGLILHLGFFAGMREGEMLACTPDWFWISDDWTRGSITIQATPILFRDGNSGWWKPKTKQKRTIPIHPRLLEYLKNYKMRRPYMIAPEQALWPGDEKNSKRFDTKRAMKSHGKKCGVDKLAYHILRHSFGTHLAIAGKSMHEIAGLLGDTLKVTEDHYVGFSQSKSDSLDCL